MLHKLVRLLQRYTDPEYNRMRSPRTEKGTRRLMIGGLVVAISGLIGIAYGVLGMKSSPVKNSGIRVESNVIISSSSRGAAADIHYFETITAESDSNYSFRGIKLPVPDSFEDGSSISEIFFDSAKINFSPASIEKGESKNGRTTYIIAADEHAPPSSPGEPNKITMQYRQPGVVLTDDAGRAKFSWAMTRPLSPAPERAEVSVTLPIWAGDCTSSSCAPQCGCKIKFSKGAQQSEIAIAGDFIRTPQQAGSSDLLTYHAVTPRQLSVFEYVSCACEY